MKTDFGSLRRDLDAGEERLLLSLGAKLGRQGMEPLIKRAFLAMKVESQGNGSLTEEEKEVLQYYIKYPEELRVIASFPPRTQSYQLCDALRDHYLLRNDGRMRCVCLASGPRRNTS